MTNRFEVITDDFEISIKDRLVRDFPFSIQCENIDEFEPLLQEIMNVNARLNKVWEQTQRFEEYSQEYLQRANQLEEENEQLKKELSEYKDSVFSDDKILCYTCLFCTHKGIYEVDCDVKGHVDVHGTCHSYTKKELEE